jgi:uncharacterized protein (TIGR00369 family)
MGKRMEPINANYEANVHDSFSRQTIMSLIGANLSRVAPGQVEILLPIRHDLKQQVGAVHAGVLTTILDSASGYAAYTLMPEGSDVLSVEFKVNLLAPAFGETVVAKARVLRAGKTLTICQADAFTLDTNGVEVHVATMLSTMIARKAQV